MDVPNYYAILEVDRHASARQISRAFRRLAFIHHPDLNKAPTAEATFKLINQAYQILSDAEARTHYNLIWDEVYQGHAPTSDHGDESSAQDEKTRQERVTRDQMSHSPATGAGVVRDTRYWLRWAAVLPGAFVGAAIISILAVNILSIPSQLGWSIVQGVTTFTFVVSGAYIAPEKNYETAIGLVALDVLLIALNLPIHLLDLVASVTGLTGSMYVANRISRRTMPLQ